MTVLHISDPEPGFYQRKRVRGGVWTPVLVFRPCPMDPFHGYPMQRWPQLRCIEDGEEISSGRLEQIWPYLRPTSRKEYIFLAGDPWDPEKIGLHEWAKRHAPHLPEAKPHEPVNLDQMEPIF